MKTNELISGFSKWSKAQKIKWLVSEFGLAQNTAEFLSGFELSDSVLQSIVSDLSENHISNYHLPFAVAPNFLVDGKLKVFPLVTEESSVVAALAKAAGFWAKRGGFQTQILGNEKKGQIHFSWKGDSKKLGAAFSEIRKKLLIEVKPISQNMEKRGGGITSVELKYLPEILPNYYQIDVSFDTQESMGANFINSCLEQFGKSLQTFVEGDERFLRDEKELEIIMCILSNYVPNSRVKVWVECPVEELAEDRSQAADFAGKFVRAVHIAKNDISRAVTHNKGILNGVDALAIATGNDFRAIEAGSHAFASRNGNYSGLSDAKIENGMFLFSMEISMSVGVVGGVTKLHPLAKLAMQILENPSANELMGFLAIAGLASNWSALKALITTGIQKGHMKMHLSNILNSLNASEFQKETAAKYFQNRQVSFSEVEKFITKNG